jgi:hypothetical protein
MNIVVIIVVLVVLATIGFVTVRVFGIVKAKNQNRAINKQRLDRMKPLADKFENGIVVTREDVLPYAKELLTREMTFHLLTERNKLDLFPEEFRTLIRGAESNLANWLEFPTELGTCPDEIEHIKRVSIDFDEQNNFLHYEVFKYRVKEPHWAAKGGWILGVVGPFFDDSKPYDFPDATFSRISSRLEKVTPEEEANWVHENIAMRE